MEYFIRYSLLGTECWAGPYTAEQVEEHRDDIAGYECVEGVRIVVSNAPTRWSLIADPDR